MKTQTPGYAVRLMRRFQSKPVLIKLFIFLAFNGCAIGITLHAIHNAEKRGFSEGAEWQLKEVKRMCDQQRWLLLDNAGYRCSYKGRLPKG